MKSNGDVTAVRGVSETMKKLLENGDAATKSTRDMMQRAFTDEAMKRYLGTTVLPEKPVAVGARGCATRCSRVPPLGKLKAHFDFNLLGMEDTRQTHCAKLGTKFELKLEGKPDLSAMPGAANFDIDMSMDGAQGEGTIFFSPEKGTHDRVFAHHRHGHVDDDEAEGRRQERGRQDGRWGIKISMKNNLALLGRGRGAVRDRGEERHAAEEEVVRAGNNTGAGQLALLGPVRSVPTTESPRSFRSGDPRGRPGVAQIEVIAHRERMLVAVHGLVVDRRTEARQVPRVAERRISALREGRAPVGRALHRQAVDRAPRGT
jgi:hypothetical protein